MKKTAKIKAIFSAIAATFTAFSLCACGEPVDEQTGYQEYDYETFKSERVSDASAWVAAFDLTNVVHAKFIIDDTYIDDNGTDNDYWEYIFDETNIYFTSYNKENIEILHQEVHPINDEHNLTELVNSGAKIERIINMFDEFEYDDESGSYIYYDQADGRNYYSLKIKGGKYCGSDLYMLTPDNMGTIIHCRLYLGV